MNLLARYRAHRDTIRAEYEQADEDRRRQGQALRHALYLELGIDQELWGKVDRQLGPLPIAVEAHLVIEQVLQAHEDVLAR